MLTFDKIQDAVATAAREYPVKRVDLIGSYAEGTADSESDVDFLIEFFEQPVSLMKYCGLQEYLMELLDTDVDIVKSGSAGMLNIDRKVCVYGA